MLSPQIISSSKEIAIGVYLLKFKRDFDFRAGQVIGISMDEQSPRRLYSICSGEKEDEVSILYNVVKEGLLTPQLSDLKVGDQIFITEARGDFLYDPGPAVWIASGTGIAPFYSMLRTEDFANKMLLHGERLKEKFYFADEFIAALGDKYLRCCSGEKGRDLFPGRVTDYLKSAKSSPLDFKYYLCGRAEMVVEARDILIERKIPFQNIISEIYF